MSSPIITKIIEEINDLPDDLQQQVLQEKLNYTIPSTTNLKISFETATA